MRKLFLLALLAATTVHAEFRTGNKLLDDLNGENYYAKGVAMGYIMGATDAGSGSNHCPPASVTAGQVQDMVKNTLETVPAIRHFSADLIVNYVLNKAWPCAKKGQNL